MHDKKSDHYTSPDNYRDIDGNMRTFTYVDHDKKPSISASVDETESETQERERWMANYLEEKIETTLLLPAVNIAGEASGIYEHLIIRDRENGITWDEAKVRKFHTETPTTFLNNLLWKRTVLMSNWHHPMWIDGDMEALRRGDWKQLT